MRVDVIGMKYLFFWEISARSLIYRFLLLLIEIIVKLFYGRSSWHLLLNPIVKNLCYILKHFGWFMLLLDINILMLSFRKISVLISTLFVRRAPTSLVSISCHSSCTFILSPPVKVLFRELGNWCFILVIIRSHLWLFQIIIYILKHNTSFFVLLLEEIWHRHNYWVSLVIILWFLVFNLSH